ncbi:MAG: ribbon-helix-helix domain-containing protein [Schwartzia sp.]|nr:ribbon-helix-helix domain-containing protein [Schwartzia sp. (in: firmicutes)]MBP3690307.1 ribbon-helix-helix domain-containing protein [Schwartzia sp. (in: firmicutes)]MBR1552824.1 ribbon-helix-helix domain-containing protein [Schwartzia sp. (in: firmicutes)]
MAKKLSKAELRKLAADFDPPAAKKAHHDASPPLKGGKRVRVTASLTQEQYEKLKKLAKRHGLPMSKTLGVAVEALYKH